MSRTFELTVCSNKSLDTVPGNKSNDFINTLPRTLHIPEYEMALTSIKFSDNYTPAAPAEPVLKMSFFTVFNEDNKFQVSSTASKWIRVNKVNERMDHSLSKMNQDLIRLDIGVVFYFVTEEGKITSINVECNPPEGYNVAILGDLAKIMGFDEAKPLPRGHSSNPYEMKPSVFDEHSIGTLGRLHIYHFEKDNFRLPQYEDKPSLDLLLADIVLLCNESEHDVNMHFKEEPLSIEYQIQPEDTFIHLSPFLHEYIGLPDNFVFNHVGTVLLNKDAPAFHIPPKPKEVSDLLFVECQTIEEDYFGHKALSYLACIDRQQAWSGKVLQYFKPSPVLYKRCQSHYLSSVHIRLLDGNFDLIPETSVPTKVSLVLRPIKMVNYYV